MTAAPWQELRTHANTTLPQTATHTRPADTPTALGGKGADTTVSYSLPCRVTRLAGGEATTAARTNSAAQWAVTVPYGTDLRVQDALTVSGQRYEVVGFATGPTAILCRAWCA